jgi:flagellar biosynthesis/type III secretory pathway chaperone
MEPVDELVAVLAAQAREYHRLVPLLEEEERVLVRADAAALSDIAARRAALASRLAALERDRRAALGRVARSLGVDPAGLTVSRLLELAPAGGRALLAVREELQELLGRLLVRNGRNRFVAERTLAYLRGLFAGVAAVIAPAPAYAPSGRSDHLVHDLRLVDRRA